MGGESFSAGTPICCPGRRGDFICTLCPRCSQVFFLNRLGFFTTLSLWHLAFRVLCFEMFSYGSMVVNKSRAPSTCGCAASFRWCYNMHWALVYTVPKLFGCTMQLQTLHKGLWKLQLQLHSDFGFCRESTSWLFLFSVDWWLATQQPNGRRATSFDAVGFVICVWLNRANPFWPFPSGVATVLIGMFSLAKVCMLDALPNATLVYWLGVWLNFQGTFFSLDQHIIIFS